VLFACVNFGGFFCVGVLLLCGVFLFVVFGVGFFLVLFLCGVFFFSFLTTVTCLHVTHK